MSSGAFVWRQWSTRRHGEVVGTYPAGLVSRRILERSSTRSDDASRAGGGAAGVCQGGLAKCVRRAEVMYVLAVRRPRQEATR